ncbi:MAG: DUF1161 domain-containing protein [Rhodanobacter sp.]
MKARTGIAALLLFALPMFAYASCDSVKAGIDAKIKANGVSSYTLEVVAADKADAAAGKVVGECEGDKKIVYSRGNTTAPADQHAAPASASSSGG